MTSKFDSWIRVLGHHIEAAHNELLPEERGNCTGSQEIIKRCATQPLTISAVDVEHLEVCPICWNSVQRLRAEAKAESTQAEAQELRQRVIGAEREAVTLRDRLADIEAQAARQRQRTNDDKFASSQELEQARAEAAPLRNALADAIHDQEDQQAEINVMQRFLDDDRRELEMQREATQKLLKVQCELGIAQAQAASRLQRLEEFKADLAHARAQVEVYQTSGSSEDVVKGLRKELEAERAMIAKRRADLEGAHRRLECEQLKMAAHQDEMHFKTLERKLESFHATRKDATGANATLPMPPVRPPAVIPVLPPYPAPLAETEGGVEDELDQRAEQAADLLRDLEQMENTAATGGLEEEWRKLDEARLRFSRERRELAQHKASMEIEGRRLADLRTQLEHEADEAKKRQEACNQLFDELLSQQKELERASGEDPGRAGWR